MRFRFVYYFNFLLFYYNLEVFFIQTVLKLVFSKLIVISIYQKKYLHQFF